MQILFKKYLEIVLWHNFHSFILRSKIEGGTISAFTKSVEDFKINILKTNAKIDFGARLSSSNFVQIESKICK